MKYGYLYYRKRMLENKKERPMNLGDPIQSLAAIEILKKVGIPEKDIIPIDRYDLASYEGEEVILLINGAESYEHYAYHTKFLPISKKIIPVFASIALYRELSEDELLSFQEHQPIGCRDEYTVSFLKKKGIDAFLTGCLTLTFPKRQCGGVNKVFLVDCAASLKDYIPENLKQKAVSLSQIIRIKSESETNRLTDWETDYYMETAKKQLYRWREEAALVITSRLHTATPCAAMGIPVILAKDVFDGRFRFIDRFLPLYTPEKYAQIDWQPPIDCIPEQVKEEIVSCVKILIDLAVSRKQLKKIYHDCSQGISFCTEEEIVVEKLPLQQAEYFTYAIWGVCLPNSYWLYEAMEQRYPNAKLVCAIDTWARGNYKDDIPIISPDCMEKELPKDTVILVVAGAAHKDAVEKLTGKFRYILIEGAQMEAHMS